MPGFHSILASVSRLVTRIVSTVRQLVTPTPAVPPEPKKRRRQHVPDVLRGDEPERLIAAATNERDRMAFLIARYCGLRVAEIVALCVEHIHLEDSILQVIAGKGNKDRNVPISPKLTPALSAWIGERTSGWLFHSPKVPGAHISTRTMQKAIKDAAETAGIDPTRIHMHLWRHSAATELLKKCHDIRLVQRFLGHSSVATTQIYCAVDDQDVQAAVALL